MIKNIIILLAVLVSGTATGAPVYGFTPEVAKQAAISCFKQSAPSLTAPVAQKYCICMIIGIDTYSRKHKKDIYTPFTSGDMVKMGKLQEMCLKLAHPKLIAKKA